MPRFMTGMKSICVLECEAASGAATASSAPWPNRSGVREIFFSSAYAMKVVRGRTCARHGAKQRAAHHRRKSYFGKRHPGSIYGCLLMLFFFGVSIGPFMYGFARLTLGNCSVIFLIAAALAVFSACLMPCLPAYREESRPLDDGSAPDKGALQV